MIILKQCEQVGKVWLLSSSQQMNFVHNFDQTSMILGTIQCAFNLNVIKSKCKSKSYVKLSAKVNSFNCKNKLYTLTREPVIKASIDH